MAYPFLAKATVRQKKELNGKANTYFGIENYLKDVDGGLQIIRDCVAKA